MIWTTILGDHGAKGRIKMPFGIDAWCGSTIGRLHHHVRLMIAVPAIDGTNEREFIEHGCLFRQELADMGARQLRGDGLEGATNFNRHVRLWVPGIDLRGAAGHPEKDDRLS